MIGVVQDFHFSPLRDKIGPVALTLRHQQFYNLGARVKAEGIERRSLF